MKKITKSDKLVKIFTNMRKKVTKSDTLVKQKSQTCEKKLQTSHKK